MPSVSFAAGESKDTLGKIICLRNSRIAVTLLKKPKLKIHVDEARHVAHDTSARLSQVPTSASNLAQSREADDSSMFPLSDPE